MRVSIARAIHKDDSIEVDGVAVPMTSLKEELGKRLAKDSFMVVTLISQPKTNRETTAAVLNVCKALKIRGITLTVAEGN